MLAEPRETADQALDDAMALCMEPGGLRAELVQWLAEHPELAGQLADQVAAAEHLDRWIAPLRVVPIDDPTVSYSSTAKPASLAFGDFEILGELGRGGMGIVYKARQKALDRVVALKTTLAGSFPSSRDIARLRFEAEAAAQLDHPNIVPIHGAGEYLGMPFFSMKFIGGGTLASDIKALLQDQRAAAKLLAKVARAVHFAHQHGVLHRDLKPGNILIDETGEPMVADFGLAKAIDAGNSASASGGVVGTAPYMSPEQARGGRGLTISADLYTLGAIHYELLTGRPPFRAETTYETIRQVIEQSPTEPGRLNPNSPADLEAICLKCLEKKPENRYASAAELADDLERFSLGMSVSVRPGGVVSQIVRGIRSRREVGPPGDKWVAIVAYSSAVAAVAHGAIFGLVAAESRIGWVWLALLALFAFLGVQRFRQSQRARTFVPWERHTIALWSGHLIATIALAAVMIPFDPQAPADRVLGWYPALAVLYALALFVQGSISWGGYFVASLVYIALAVALRFAGPAAPLVFAAVHVPANLFMSAAGLRTTPGSQAAT
jgi:serine/threonine-protein kinase